jgi:hypothetical protein
LDLLEPVLDLFFRTYLSVLFYFHILINKACK